MVIDLFDESTVAVGASDRILDKNPDEPTASVTPIRRRRCHFFTDLRNKNKRYFKKREKRKLIFEKSEDFSFPLLGFRENGRKGRVQKKLKEMKNYFIYI